MENIFNSVLSLMLIYSYPVIVGAILLGYLGLPLPLNLLIVAAGAFTANQTLSMFILVPLVTCTAIVGDMLGYYVGFKYGNGLLSHYAPKIGLTQKHLSRLNKLLESWQYGFIFLTRWLITPLGIPINLLAGSNKINFKSFIVWAAFGELIWASLYLYVGNMFGSNWVSLSGFITDTSELLTSTTIGITLLIIGLNLLKIRRKRRTIKRVQGAFHGSKS